MIKRILTMLFLLHFGIVAYYIISKHTSLSGNKVLSKYINPFFPQEWEMFAPPPTSNTRLFYRYIIYSKGRIDTGFKEILKPLYKHQISDVYSLSRLSYYLFNSTQNIYSNYTYYLQNLPDSISRDKTKIKLYINTMMSKSYSHKSLIRHGQLIYEIKYQNIKPDSVLFSYHILDEPICKYENRHYKKPADKEQSFAWNSILYKIK